MNIVMYTPQTVACLKMYTGGNTLISMGASKFEKDVLGTIGRRAPFHSQMQKMKARRKPDNKGARMIGDDHGKVTPPFVGC